MQSVNIQAWLPATTAAVIAKYMELSGDESRTLSSIAQVAARVLEGVLTKKGISFPDEAEAIRYLARRGFAVSTSRDKRKKMIAVLQEEAMLEINSFAGPRKQELIAELDQLMEAQDGAAGK